jgi:hypothetical protein
MKAIYVAILSVLTTAAIAQPENTVSRVHMNGGGGVQSNDSWAVIGSVGQPLTGTSSSPTLIHRAGFWQGEYLAVTSIESSDDNALPQVFSLQQNYPNPFNPATTIRFGVPEAAEVTLDVFDILGRKVAALLREERQPGMHQVIVKGTGMTSGVYFYTLSAISKSGTRFVQTKKFVLLR